MLAPAKYLSFERYFESTLESTRKHSAKHSLESTLQRFFTDAVTQRYSIKKLLACTFTQNETPLSIVNFV